MISSKTFYSEYFKEFRLTPEETKTLQDVLFGILCDIDDVCKKHDIKYMLAGGTCLGAVRHKEFIPWDDDVDLIITRENYIKLRKYFNEELSGKYILAEPFVTEGYFFKMPKLYLKGSEYTEIPWAGVPGFNMIYVDIFIIDYLPESEFVRKIRGTIYDFALKAASLCIDSKYPSPIILEKSKNYPEVKRYYDFRRKWGTFFSLFFGMKFYLFIVKNLGSSKKATNIMGIPSSGNGYSREILPCEDYINTQTVMFCGREFSVPANVTAYLKHLYGDTYMQVPPEDKREYHVAYNMHIGKE